jgi:hypothetical protein
MRIPYKANIAQGIGDNIMARSYADQVKNQYEKIYFTHHAPIVEQQKNNSPEYWKFLNELGILLFSDLPFIYNDGQHPFRSAEGLITDFNITPQKPQRSVYIPLLCKGNSLKLDQEYIVLTTKLRYFDKSTFYRLSPKLWKIIKELSKKYKIVVLGERVVEMCQDYKDHGENQIYGIYEQIISNVPADKILDLTIPALGITSPTLTQIQQDCLIINGAKFTITLGVGGNFVMAMAVANMIGFRIDNEPIADTIFTLKYSDAVVSKNWDEFSNILMSYL